eukprot:2624465-Pyramimonas_sp.AAC.1
MLALSLVVGVGVTIWYNVKGGGHPDRDARAKEPLLIGGTGADSSKKGYVTSTYGAVVIDPKDQP